MSAANDWLGFGPFPAGALVEYLTRSRFCREVQIVNGLKRGMLTRALEGEDVGSIIFQD